MSVALENDFRLLRRGAMALLLLVGLILAALVLYALAQPEPPMPAFELEVRGDAPSLR